MATQKAVPTSGSLTDLCRIAEKYGTDKSGCYTPFYDLLFRDRRQSIRKVLEVGIGTAESMKHVKNYQPGASLRMWRDYFPNAEIHGVDIDESAVKDARQDRIRTWKCDQSSEEQLNTLVPHLELRGPFDVILDDGSHKPEDQLLTFRMLSPLLDSRGLYIIEDVDKFAFSSGDLPEHTFCLHGLSAENMGSCILIRGEAIHG